MSDIALARAGSQIVAAQTGVPVIEAFFDEATFTVSYVVHDPQTRQTAIIDSVLDYDPASGRTSTASADRLLAYAEEKGLDIHWLLETHAHADHLTAAPYLQQKLAAKIAIGEHIVTVQETFSKLFNVEDGFKPDGSDFDKLFTDGEQFTVGNLDVIVLMRQATRRPA